MTFPCLRLRRAGGRCLLADGARVSPGILLEIDAGPSARASPDGEASRCAPCSSSSSSPSAAAASSCLRPPGRPPLAASCHIKAAHGRGESLDSDGFQTRVVVSQNTTVLSGSSEAAAADPPPSLPQQQQQKQQARTAFRLTVDMNPDLDYGGSGSSGNGKLRQWLIEQVDCGKYPGLVWENDDKSIFRIPWKHAGKQDYNRDEDAALFKAWALFKGKFREGIDKPDPPTWKTRLRCALNKSNDFEELVERSQLDISDPYKVYRIVPEGAKKRPRQEDSPLSPMGYQVHPSYTAMQTQMPQFLPSAECEWRDYCQEPPAMPEVPFAQCPCPPRSLPWQGPAIENGYQLRASIYSYGPTDSQPSPFALDASIRSAEALSDCRLHLSIYVQDSLVREVTVSSPEGCHLTPSSQEDKHYLQSGGPEVVPLPVDVLSAQRRAPAGGDECSPSPPSPSALDRGLLLWMGPDGLYARRLCQSRVYWQGALSQYGDKPSKLEREVNCKLLHTQDCLTEIQSYGLHGRPPPRFQILLSFGDECLDPQRQRRPLTVQVEPLFSRQLLYYAQQMGAHYYRSYEHAAGVADHINASEEYQRAVSHHHNGSLQE